MFLYRADGRWFVVQFSGASATYRGGTWSSGFTVQRTEFNGDGRADLFLYNPTTGAWSVAVTQADGTFAVTGAMWAAGWQTAVTDLNADGISDLLLYHPTLGRWAQVSTTTPGACCS